METLTDADGRTSVPEVFAIGDGARFGGAQAAMAQGSLAARPSPRSRPGGRAEPRRRRAWRGARFQAPCGAVRGGAAAGRRDRRRASSAAARR
jgi:hypothetical protein